jgi:hypothetical protein
MQVLRLVLVSALIGMTPASAIAARVIDPVGDTLSSATDPKLDAVEVRITLSATSVEVRLVFDPAVGTSDNLQALGGYVDFDVDMSTQTGRTSHIDEFAAPPALHLGVDYYLNFLQHAGLAELLYCPDATHELSRGLYDVVPTDHGVVIVLDRVASVDSNGICLSGPFWSAMVVGNDDGPTDRVPNGSTPIRVSFPGDLDYDGDVDLSDFGRFQGCFNGPNRTAARSDCADADLDNDADVDLTDFARFQACFNGPNRTPAAGCHGG